MVAQAEWLFKLADKFGFNAMLVVFLLVAMVLMFRWYGKRDEVREKRHAAERRLDFTQFLAGFETVATELKGQRVQLEAMTEIIKDQGHEIREIRKTLDFAAVAR